MRILVVHNRYRSAAPSGENRVVDHRGAALTELGHDVGGSSGSATTSRAGRAARKATLPAQVVWNARVRRDLARGAARAGRTWCTCTTRSRCSARSSCTPAGTRACRSWRPCTTTAGLRQRRLLPRRRGLPRLRAADARPGRAARLLPRLAGRHRAGRDRPAAHRRAWRTLVSAYVFISAVAARPARRASRLPPDRVFVRHNLVPARAAVPATAGGPSSSTPGGWTTPKACGC